MNQWSADKAVAVQGVEVDLIAFAQVLLGVSVVDMVIQCWVHSTDILPCLTRSLCVSAIVYLGP